MRQCQLIRTKRLRISWAPPQAFGFQDNAQAFGFQDNARLKGASMKFLKIEFNSRWHYLIFCKFLH